MKKLGGFPRKVDIGYETFPIERTKGYVARKKKKVTYGRYDTLRRAIKISERGPSIGWVTDTLLHELLHALWDYSGLISEFDQKDEEKIVTKLTPALLSLIRQNPKLIDWIQDAVH